MPDCVLRDELLESERWLWLPNDTDRLVYVGLLLRCDSLGNLEGGSRRLFRFMASFAQVKSEEGAATVLLHLVDADLIRRYEAGDHEFWHIPRFRNPSSYIVRKYPPSPWDDPKITLGKHIRTVRNKGLAKNIPSTSPERTSDVLQGVGVGVGVSDLNTTGFNNGSNADREAVDNSETPDEEKHGSKPLNGAQWWKSNQGIEAMGRTLDFPALPGEMHGAYKDRLFQEIARLKRFP